MNPAINRDGSVNDEGNTRFDNSRWKCDLELCTVLHKSCELCEEWIEHHHDDTTSLERAKVSFHTGRDEALVSKQVNLEREMRAARQETEALQHELQEVQAEIEWVKRDQQTIEDAGKQWQLQVVGKIHEIGGASHSRSSPSDPSSRRPRKRLRQTHTPSQYLPMTPPFTAEQRPIHVGSGSEQEPIHVGSDSEGA